jgi:hypothetical protein
MRGTVAAPLFAGNVHGTPAGSVGSEAVRVEYRYIQAMTCRGNRRVRVDPDGRVFADVAEHDCRSGEHWNGPWPDQPTVTLTADDMARLHRQIETAGVMALPPEIMTQGRDGFREELDVAIGERRHSVRVERARVPPGFQQVRDALLRLAGLE